MNFRNVNNVMNLRNVVDRMKLMNLMNLMDLMRRRQDIKRAECARSDIAIRVLQVNRLNQLIEVTKLDLKRDDRQRITNLITMDAHARDAVAMLIREAVTSKARSIKTKNALECSCTTQYLEHSF